MPLTCLTGTAKTDIVYIEPIIGIGEFAISDHRSSQPSYEEVIRLASEAHVAGLITGKAGIIHFHLGDGDRKLALIERALADTELPPRVFNPTHVNRNKPLFEQSCDLLAKGCYIDLTAFTEGACAPGWSAAEAIALLVSRDLPLNQVTVSSDGGGCLPSFDARGELTHMDFGRCDTLIETLQQTIAMDIGLEQSLPLFTSNVATLLRLPHKGHLRPGSDADLIALNSDHSISDVMAMGVWHVRAGQQIVKGMFE